MKFKTSGVCSRYINIDVENGIVKNVTFEGGCSGNTQGIATLVVGMKKEDVIEKLKGIRCGFRSTSCPDQLARALESMNNE